MKFINLFWNGEYIAMFRTETDIKDCDVEDIRKIAEEVFDEHGDDMDEMFESIIQKCAEELNIELLLCSADYEIEI